MFTFFYIEGNVKYQQFINSPPFISACFAVSLGNALFSSWLINPVQNCLEEVT